MKHIPGLSSLCSVEGLPAIPEVGISLQRGADVSALAELNLCSAANPLAMTYHFPVPHFLISKVWIVIPTYRPGDCT